MLGGYRSYSQIHCQVIGEATELINKEKCRVQSLLLQEYQEYTKSPHNSAMRKDMQNIGLIILETINLNDEILAWVKKMRVKNN